MVVAEVVKVTAAEATMILTTTVAVEEGAIMIILDPVRILSIVSTFKINFINHGIKAFRLSAVGPNISGNDLMQLMSAMASNFSMSSQPPQPMRQSCGELRNHHCGMFVEISGRLIKKRVNRFAELRDRNGGACQLVVLEDKHPRVARRMNNMPENTTLTIVGQVMRRPNNSCNQTMPTGEIEVEVQDILSIHFPASGTKRAGDKRTYSTMVQQQSSLGITSTEYKIASK